MADIKQRITIDGADQVKRDLAGIGDAGKQAFGSVKQAADQAGNVGDQFNFAGAQQQLADLVNAARSLVQTFDQAAQGAQHAGGAIRELGNSIAGSSKQAGDGASQFGSIALKAAATVGAIAGIGIAIFEAAKKAAEGATDISKAADTAGASLEGFQQAKFVLEQMGLSSKDAEAAIASLAEKSGDATKKLVDRIAQMGFRFVDAGDDAKFVQEQVDRLGGSNVALDPLLAKLRAMGVAVPVGTTEQLKNATETIQRMAAAQPGLSGALAKLKDQQPDVVAAIKGTAEAIASFTDEGLQKQAAINAFGDELGPKLVDKLKEGSKGIDEFLSDFQGLRLGIGQGAVDLSSEFNAAMARFTTASQTARIEFGSRFLPIVTEGIKQFTNLMRLNKGPLDEFAKSTADSFKQLAQDIFAIFNGNGNEIKTGWLATIRDLVVGVAIPALKGLADAAQPVIDKINALFGTNFSTAGAALTAVLATLIGGFNALLVVVVALFTGSSPLLDKFRAGLASVGIDIEGIKKVAAEAWAQIKALFSSQGSISTPFGELKIDASTFAQTVLAIVAAFLLLRKAGELVAPILSAVVGRQISGEATLFAGVLAQLSGIAGALEGALVGVAAATTIFRNVVSGALFLLQTAAAVVGWPLVLAAGIVLAITNFRQFASVLDPIAKALNNLFGTQFFSGLGLALTALGGLFVGLLAQMAIVERGVALLRTAFTGLAASVGIGLFPLVAIFAAIGAAAALALAVVDKGFRETLLSGADTVFNKLKDLASAQSWDELKQKMGLVGDSGKKAADDTGSAFEGLIDKLKGFSQSNVDPTAKLSAGADALANKAQTVGSVLGDFKKTAADTWTFVGDGAKTAGDKVGAISQAIGDQGDKFKTFGDRLNAAFDAVATQTQKVDEAAPGLGSALEALGGKLDDVKQKASDLGDAIRAAFSALNPIGSAQAGEGAGSLLEQAGGNASAGAANALTAPFQAAAEQIKALWGELAAFIAEPGLFAGVAAVEGALVSPFQSAADLIRSAWQGLAGDVEAIVAQIIASAEQAISALQQAASAASSASSGGGFDVTGGSGATFAGGGFVQGPGSTTSDSILAWLSNYEFVQPAARVFQYGRDFMEAIRSGALPTGAVRSLMANLRGFRAGGLVERLAVNFAPVALPRFADGGMAVAAPAGSGLQPVNLHLSVGRPISLFGAPSAIDELTRRAKLDLNASTGTSPAWRRR